MGDEVLVTVEEAARRLALSRSVVYALIGRGELGSLKIGSSRRVPVDALDAFVARLAGPLSRLDATPPQDAP